MQHAPRRSRGGSYNIYGDIYGVINGDIYSDIYGRRYLQISTQVVGAGQVVGVLDSTLASCVMELSPGPDNTTRIMSGRTGTR